MYEMQDIMILVKTISKIFKHVDVLISNRNQHIAKIAVIIAATSIMIVAAIPALSFAQQQQQVTDFIANLSGKDVSPPVYTPATGVAKFHVNPNDTISYEISVNNIDKVIDSFMGPKNNTDLIELINPYATTLSGPRDINQFKSAYPTGPVNGVLTSGVITTDHFIGPLAGKTISDLANMMKTGQFQVDVRTIAHESGEIAGQIVPGK
jgi:CHRD domain